MARVCVFDVNETLLDLRALDPHFEAAFGDAGVRRAWFLQLLQSALVATVTGSYSDFGQVGGAALEMVAEREGLDLSDEDRQKTLGGMRELPPHPGVAESLGVEVGQVRLVAAHAWDVAGALRAGCAAAFVARPGMVLDPLADRPDVVGADLREVADRILEIESG
jgi:FMN phosphatase YigB (HAD superfamily)